MFKKFYKKSWGHRILFGFLVAVATIVVLILIALTPIGSGVLKKVLESKIDRYIPQAQITYLDYGVNNFSLVIKKGHNILKVYGAVFPLSAMFDGNIEDLSELSPYYQGKMNLSGKIYIDKENVVIEGMSFFAQGYMNFITRLNDDVILHAKGSDFDIQRLLYILKFDYPYISGKTDIKIDKNENSKFNVVFKSSGKYKKQISTDFKAITKVTMNHKNRFDFTSKIFSDVGDIDLSGKYLDGKWGYDFKSDDLSLGNMKPVLLYPFKGITSIHGSYESTNNILKFKGRDFEGFYDNRIELTFNTDAKDFFRYIGIKQILNGHISGTLKINEKFGSFDIVSNDSKFLPNKTLKRLRYLIGIDLSKEKTGKIFFKGYFDSKKAVFDMLSTNQNLSISIKKGVFTYPDNYKYILYIRKGNKVYKIQVNNGRLRVLERRDFRERDNKVLVF